MRQALYIGTARPGSAHTAFARLPFKQVLTTNFDFLLERAYDGVNKSYLPVIDEDLLSFDTREGEIRLIKMHGDVHHPSALVLTEGDYDGFRDERKRMFGEVAYLLSRHSVLFVGYSIDDPDFRQILRLVDNDLGEFKRSAYAFVCGASEVVAQEYVNRGVTRVIRLGGAGDDYCAVLTAAFGKIAEAVTKV